MTLDKKTTISIGTAFTVGAILVRMFAWFWSVDANATYAKTEVSGVKVELKRMEKAIWRLEVKNGTLPKDWKDDAE